MIDLEWVSDYIDISDQDLKELAVKITKAGINIEKVITNHIDNLVIGEVIECVEHKDSDHLHVCKVDTKDTIRQIVCGAPNVRAGIKVIVALPGCILPGDFKIKPGKIRGEESDGMLCALYELGLEEKTDENYAKGICELGSDAKVGSDPLVYLGLSSTMYELDIHKHRNNDCYYHIGFAYEIGCIIDRKVTLPDDNYNEIDDNINNYFSLEINTSKCPYYLAKMVKDVHIKESPDFIKKRLNRAGIRSINNVVDISNYVMLEYGQPMHFYDKDKIGNKIVVRNSLDNEEVKTLDSETRRLTSDDIVITNGNNIICVAGVMGGENSEVDENTKNILIESAIFDPVSVRYTATRLNLRSEASIRFGKGLSYEYTNKAMARACHLLEKYADAKILTGIVQHDTIKKVDKKVSFKADEINSMLGIQISTEDMKKELTKLDFDYKLVDDTFEVTIPKRRLDIDASINDIAEEIGRLYGYHNLESKTPVVAIKKGEYKGEVKYRKLMSKRLRSLGLSETKTYTLVSKEMADMFRYEDKKQVVLPNPMSTDKMIVRTTLIPSLLNVYKYNKKRKVNNINIYEISKTYDADYKEEIKVGILMSDNYITNTWNNSLKVDFYLIKGIIENILNYMGFKNRYDFDKILVNELHKGVSASILLDKKQIGIIGLLHPSISKDNIFVAEISLTSLMARIKPLKYKQASIYPEIEKDLAFIVKKDMSAKEIIDSIKKSGGKLLKDIIVFDVYTGENVANDEKSIAFKLIFNDENKTLTDEEVMMQFNKIIDFVTKKCNATLRNR